MHKLIGLFLSIALLTSCAALASALPVINSAVTDTQLVLKGIETTFEAYQLSHPVQPTDRAEYEQLLAQAYHALALGERTLADLKQIDQGQYDAAIKDFSAAYSTLVAFLKTQGVTPASAGLVGVGTGTPDAFPVPRVIGLRVNP